MTSPGFPRLRYSFVSDGYDTPCLWVTSPGFPRLRYSFVSDVTRLSTVTIQLCEWRHQAFHGYDTALFVSDVTRLSTFTIQLCEWRLRYTLVCEWRHQAFHRYDTALWVTLPGFPWLRYRFVCDWRHKTVHSYDTAFFVRDVTRLSTVTIQLCLCATLPGFPRLGYRFVCDWRHKALLGCLVATDNKWTTRYLQQHLQTAAVNHLEYTLP